MANGESMGIAKSTLTQWTVAIALLAALWMAPGASSANDECLGEDGLALCTDYQHTTWRYGVGFVESFPRHIRTECAAKGGVLVGGIYGACIGGAEPTDDAGVAPLATAIASSFYNVCGLTGQSTDTGWGNFAHPAGYGDTCDIPNDNIETQCRWFGISGSDPSAQGCPGTTTTVSIYASKNRSLVCPNGYVGTNTSNGWRCVRYQCGSRCADGVNPESNGNRVKEDFFESPNPLMSVSGTWDSQGTYVVPGTAGDPETARNAGWKNNFESRLFVPASMSGVQAIIHTSSGEVRAYGTDGVAMHAWPEGKDRIEALPGGWWARHRVDQVQEQYDPAGHLVRLQSPDGSFVQIDRLPDGRIESLEDESGRAVVFGYTGDRLTLLDLPDGGEVVLSYTYDGKLESIRRADGTLRRYSYDYYENLTEIADEAGTVLKQFVYNSIGVVSTVRIAPAENNGNGLATRTYLRSSYGTTITDESGNAVGRSYINAGGLRKLAIQSGRCAGCGDTAKIDYDANGYPMLEEDFEGHSVRRTFDALGRETRYEEGLEFTGTWSCPSGADLYPGTYGAACSQPNTCWSQSPYPGGQNAQPLGYPGWYYSCPLAPPATATRRTETDWDGDSHRPSERRVYDAGDVQRERLSWTYNTRGQVLTATQTDPTTLDTRTTTYSYCEAADAATVNSTCPIVGRLKSVDGPATVLPDITTFEYYAADNLTGCATGGVCHRKGDLHRVTSTMGHQVTYARYDLAGRAVKVLDANQVATDLEFETATARADRLC